MFTIQCNTKPFLECNVYVWYDEWMFWYKGMPAKPSCTLLGWWDEVFCKDLGSGHYRELLLVV